MESLQSDNILLLQRTKPRQGFFAYFNSLVRQLSPSERLILYALSVALSIGAFLVLSDMNSVLSTEVPADGGSLVEGAIGTPRFINPLLAVSEVDQDLTALVFSGLLRAKPDGSYLPDLADSYEISDDGTVYTIRLRQNATFHDGTPITSADVLFTVSMATNPEVKSPRRVDWEGVQVDTPDEHTIVFTLPHAYAPFRENVTLGILPKALWENVSPEEFPFEALNTHPVGSGPYRVAEVTLDTTGAPTSYTLLSFKNFTLNAPHIRMLSYIVFPNEEELLHAYENSEIDSFVAASPKTLPRTVSEDAQTLTLNLARVFGIFFNQNHATVLANASVREALDTAIDKEAIIDSILSGYGTALNGPIPPGLLPRISTVASSSAVQPEVDRSLRVESILSKAGWKKSEPATTTEMQQNTWTKDKAPLSLSLATADTPELVATAHAVEEMWRAAGIDVHVQVYPLAEFNQDILRPRAYDAVLFGEVVGRPLDLFAFWHSSQRNDPGLNLAQYTNASADKLLASARAETKFETRATTLHAFVQTLNDDHPAVFLYAPSILYVLPPSVQGVSIGTLTSPSDRFVSVHEWYRDTERVWNIFTK